MGVTTEFETLEQQFLELIGEFRTLTISESRLRGSLRTESTRAEAAEAARATAERAAAEARNGAAAATAAVNKATTALASTQEHLTGLKIHLDLTERQRKLLEDRCSEMTTQIGTLERQVQQLKPVQSAHCTLQRQYTDLQERICRATEEARRECSRLESELRRVEKCASAGSEIRERARLAAAAHARERRLASAELQHTNKELLAANAEISKLRATVTELRLNLSEVNNISSSKKTIDPDVEALAETRAALEAERAGAVNLERALAAALADNATLAARLNTADNNNDISESRLRGSLRTESTRAEAAEAARATAERAAAEARNGAAAATAAVNKATTALASTQEHLTGLKIHLDLTERQRKLLEDRCSEMTTQIGTLERQVQQLKPVQSAHCTLQRQYTDLQERICRATEEARRECSRLESELRRVEKCASAGSEIRERARLAAAAHARERRLASAELQHTNKELLAANAEISKLRATVTELRLNLSEVNNISSSKKTIDPDVEALAETRAALEAERAGAVNLERALAAALADNATLAARLNTADNNNDVTIKTATPPESSATNICPIDSFLAE